MRKIKTACLYCGLETEMEVKGRYFAADGSDVMYEIECPRCRRLFTRVMKEDKGEVYHGGSKEGAGET